MRMGGGLIGKTQTSTTTDASGIWQLNAQHLKKSENKWPIVIVFNDIPVSWVTYRSNGTLSNNDRTFTTFGAQGTIHGSQIKTSGKWCFEITVTGGYQQVDLGLASKDSIYYYMASNLVRTTASYVHYASFYSAPSLSLVNSGSFTFNTPNIPVATDNRYLFAVDCDSRKAWICVDGSWVKGNPETGVDPSITWSESLDIVPMCTFEANGPAITINGGGVAFANQLPSGFNPGWYETQQV